MKKLLSLILLGGALACASASRTPHASGSPQIPGAATPRGAVERFFNAVRAGDLQEIGVAWGTAAGPARDHIERNELEKREVVLQCYFNHDTFRITGESPGLKSARLFQIQVTRGKVVRNTSATVVRGSADRWYVESLDIQAVRDMCSSAPKNP